MKPRCGMPVAERMIERVEGNWRRQVQLDMVGFGGVCRGDHAPSAHPGSAGPAERLARRRRGQRVAGQNLADFIQVLIVSMGSRTVLAGCYRLARRTQRPR